MTHRTWLADELAQAARELGYDAAHSLGLDLPAARPGDAVWAPMEWAARARAGGADWLTLHDTGPAFLTGIDEQLTGRRILLATTADLRRGHTRTVDGRPLRLPEHGFFKPANVKDDRLPAGEYSLSEYARRAAAAGMPDDTLHHLTDTLLHLVVEYRTYVLDHTVVTSSAYLSHDPDGTQTTWPECRTTSIERRAAESFATRVVASLTDSGERSGTYVLDVALTTSGRWVVVETNPVWSANPYDADRTWVVRSLFDAVAPTYGHAWEPDAHLLAKAARMRPLR